MNLFLISIDIYKLKVFGEIEITSIKENYLAF